MLRARRRKRLTGVRRRTLIAVVAALVVVLPVGWMWADSLVPASYSVEDMGTPDYGGGPGLPMGHAGHGSLPVHA